MKLRIVCKDENISNNDELSIKCEVCRGKDIVTMIKMLKEEYDIDEVIIPNCEILKHRCEYLIQ
ncbi:conserved protein of unknown function [Methanocaldococcus lauensis]|uniref:Uncharacterized protein n=1 Tax=Methanocaldococcus lauensis TaxID=2546128 RepID=A0A8D6SVL6_9EURY|nr:hypothetical protein [Methanocaldococcus lauensis]CAB3289871.1 conserved protein of unknown function [Methanocaldococcus lauensis]